MGYFENQIIKDELIYKKEGKPDPNLNLSAYLQTYCKLQSPHYAVLLTGEWGSGKTHFIKKFIDSNKNHKFLYISLYGLSSKADVDNEIFAQLHPWSQNKALKLASGLISASLSTGIVGKMADDLYKNLSTKAKNIPSYLRNPQDKILVFDDLERCKIPSQELLGIINQHVEHNDMKVIIIANENEIKQMFVPISDNGVRKESKLDQSQESDYHRTKEKIIGKTISVEPDYESAFIGFLDLVIDEKSRDMLKAKEILIKEIYETAEYGNLRHLRQSIIDFPNFHNQLPPIAFEKQEVTDIIIRTYFLINMEIKSGNIRTKEIGELFVDFIVDNKSRLSEESRVNLRKKYKIENSTLINLDPIFQFFANNHIPATEIEYWIRNSSFYFNDRTPDWQRIMSFTGLDDDEFKTRYTNVWSEFKQNKFDDQVDLLRIISLLIFLSRNEISDTNINDIIDQSYKNINDLNSENKLIPLTEEMRRAYHYFNLGNHSENDADLIKIKDYLIGLVDKASNETQIQDSIPLFENLKSNINEFEKQVTQMSIDSKYYKEPILPAINPRDFAATIFSISNENKSKLYDILKKRYDEYGSELQKEIPWLKEVYKELIAKNITYANGPGKYILDKEFIPGLQTIIMHMEMRFPTETASQLQ